MHKLLLALSLMLVSAAFGEGQLWLSPVSGGDCVAPRLFGKRSSFLNEWEKKSCLALNSDRRMAAKCVENVMLDKKTDVAFFTDRCSEKEFFIGLNGSECRLRRVSRRQKPHHFIGSFVGDDVSVEIDKPHLLKKTYTPNEPKTEDRVLDAEYAVRVTVRKGAVRKIFWATLWYGR
jgi:hypothetical protein